jgi:beta-N-acetylhexosaminidase
VDGRISPKISNLFRAEGDTIRRMDSPFHDLAGRVLVAGFDGKVAPAPVLADLAASRLAGVILFKRNLGGPEEVMALNASLIDAAPPGSPPLIGVDQEGGRVARLGPPVAALPPMRRLGARDDPRLTERAGSVLGAQLAALGFSMDFAPVLDVDTNPDNPVIGDRAFSDDPEHAAAHALAFSDGLLSAGVASCGKHFPGHGDTDLDSHLALPTLAHPRERLDAVELAPFRAAKGRIPAIMTAHVIFEALDPGVPATMSRVALTSLLRGELGYEGAIISDDLEMRAVYDHFGVAETAVRAIEAGCDLLLVCSKLDELERAREALATKAELDPSFRARLEDAASRGLALRRAFPPRVDAEAFARTAPAAELLVRELDRL